MKIKLVKSPYGTTPRTRKTVKAIGFSKLNQTREIDENNKALMGMVNKVKHLLVIEKKDK